MVLDQYVRDFKAFMEEFATALDSNRAKFYLDTSFLIWLIRVGAEARRETLEWLQSRSPIAVRVPVWTAHELHRHILRGTARINLKNTVDETRAKLEDFVTMAAERADDRACNTHGFANRTTFVQELQLSSVKFSQLAKVVALDDRSLQRAKQEVIDFANQRMLSTNLDPIIAKLDRTAAFRTSHRAPPGFHDDKKEDNKDGDLVIWEEIVRDLRASRDDVAEGRDVIFISRDQKTDWVSAAPSS